jgi:hypothetical protein
MSVIVDNDGDGLMMIPLFSDWGVHRCNVWGCAERPFAIITQIPDYDGVILGLCKEHFKSFCVESPSHEGYDISLHFTAIFAPFDPREVDGTPP